MLKNKNVYLEREREKEVINILYFVLYNLYLCVYTSYFITADIFIFLYDFVVFVYTYILLYNVVGQAYDNQI